MDQQHAKERACYLAALRGFALFSRGHQVYSVTPDGRTRLVCGSRSYLDVWGKAHQVMVAESERVAPSPRMYRVATPHGVFEATTWWGLLWQWFRNRQIEVHDDW